MRATSMMIAALAISVFLNIGLWRHCSTLTDKNDALLAEITKLEASREADMAAIAVANYGHQQAAQQAQEARNALHDLEKNLSDLTDAELCVRLRGMFSDTSGTCRFDAAGQPAAGMSGTDATK